MRRVRRVRIPFVRSTFLPIEAGAVRSIRFPTFFVRFNLRLSLFREEKLCIRILLNISSLVFMRKSHLNQFGRRRSLRLESELQERIEFTTIRVLARMLQPTSCWRLYGEQGWNLLVIITTPDIVLDIQNLLPPTCDLYRTRISYSGNWASDPTCVKNIKKIYYMYRLLRDKGSWIHFFIIFLKCDGILFSTPKGAFCELVLCKLNSQTIRRLIKNS